MADTTTPTAANAVPAAADPDIQRAAFEQVRSEIAAVTAEQLIPINIDVTYAISVALGTASFLPELRDRIEAQAHELDTEPIWKLATYAFALSYAHADYVFASTPPEELPALHDEGTKLKDRMLASAVALSLHGLLPNEQVSTLRNPAGYRNLAEYLTALSKLFRDYWADLSGKTPLSLDEVNRASELAAQLFRGAGIKARSPLAENEAALVRQRAFTLLARTYDQVRRLVAYLRWDEGDVDRLAPSIYGGRGNGGRKEKPGTDLPAPAPTDGAPAEPPADGAATGPGTTPAAPGLRGFPPFNLNNKG